MCMQAPACHLLDGYKQTPDSLMTLTTTRRHSLILGIILWDSQEWNEWVLQPCNFLQFECLVEPGCDWVLGSSILCCNSTKSGCKWLHLPQVWVWNCLWLDSNWTILGSFYFVEHVLYMHQSGQLQIVVCYNHIYYLQSWIACNILMRLQSLVELERQVACKCGGHNHM
jgi:hypothetical protein